MKQKTYTHSLQSNVLEFMVGTLASIQQLQELVFLRICWSGGVTNIGKSDAGDLYIDLAIRNDTQDLELHAGR